MPLAEGESVALDVAQANYLGNVLRLKTGDSVLVFNGRDGEWRGSLTSAGKRKLALTIEGRTRAQTNALDLHYLFAPLKHARLDYMAQQAVEMGAARLPPGHTPPRPDGTGQSRAPARQCYRGGGAVRHPDAAGHRRPAGVRAHARGTRSGSSARVLRRGSRGKRPDRRPRAGARCRPVRGDA